MHFWLDVFGPLDQMFGHPDVRCQASCVTVWPAESAQNPLIAGLSNIVKLFVELLYFKNKTLESGRSW